jgi:ribosome maturation protein Sdo1
MFPFLLSKLKDRETPVEEGVTLNQIQKKYIRKFHQAKVKIKFYRDYTKKLEEKLKKFDVNEI